VKARMLVERDRAQRVLGAEDAAAAAAVVAAVEEREGAQARR
jgi:hypothetical protein